MVNVWDELLVTDAGWGHADYVSKFDPNAGYYRTEHVGNGVWRALLVWPRTIGDIHLGDGSFDQARQMCAEDAHRRRMS